MDAPKKREHQMEGDHIGICKFGRYKGDRNWFRVVTDSMRYLIEQSPKAIGWMARFCSSSPALCNDTR